MINATARRRDFRTLAAHCTKLGWQVAISLILVAGLAACGDDGSGKPASTTYTVGGSVAGLPSGSSVLLQDNGGDNLTVSADGAFTFATAISAGGAYAVTVLTQPAKGTCTVTGGSGSIGSANYSGAAVTCITNTYTVGGTLSGLTAAGLVLQDNGGDNLTVATNAGSFTFATALPSGNAYAITILTQPTGQMCAVKSGGTGTIAAANYTGAVIQCMAGSATVGGTVSGLSAAGLTLQDNGGDNLAVAANASTFTFATPLGDDATYSVTVLAQPAGETCTVVSGGGGSLSGINYNGAVIDCAVNTVAPAFAYVGNDTDSTLSVYSIAAATGALTAAATPTVPLAAGAGAGEVKVAPSGKFLYVVNDALANAPGTVSGFQINATTGALTPVPNSPFATGTKVGNYPFSLTFDSTGSYLYVANSGDATIAQYSINAATGELTALTPATFALKGQNQAQMITLGANLVVVDFNTSQIEVLAIGAGGTLSEPNAPTTTTTQGPYAVVGHATVSPQGPLFYVLTYNKTAKTSAVEGYILSAAGLLTPVPGSPYTSINNLNYFATIDPTGNYLLTTAYNGTTSGISVYPITATTGALGAAVVGSIFLSGSADIAYSLVFDASGQHVYLVDQVIGNGAATTPGDVLAFAFNPSTGVLKADASIATGVSPQFMAIAGGSPAYGVGGTVYGLAAGESVTLTDGTDTLGMAANGAFTFATPLADGKAFTASVTSQPAGQTCSVTNPKASILGQDVSNVTVICSYATTTASFSGTYHFTAYNVQNNVPDQNFGSIIANGSGTGATGSYTENNNGKITMNEPIENGSYAIAADKVANGMLTVGDQTGGLLGASGNVGIAMNTTSGDTPNVSAVLKAGSGLTNATLKGAFVFTSLLGSSVNESQVITATFDGMGGMIASDVDNSGGTITNDAGGALTYSVAGDGTLAITGGPDPLTGAASPDGKTIILAEETSGATPQFAFGVKTTGAAGGSSNALLNGSYTFVYCKAGGATLGADVVFDGNGHYIQLNIDTINNNGTITADTAPVFGTYTVNADGTLQLTGDVVLTGAVAADGNSFVLAQMTSGQTPGVFVGVRQ